MKTGVIERLGEKAVLLPALIGEALAANDRIKLRLSLLQEAAIQVNAPSRTPNLFLAERRAAKLDSGGLDALITGARALSPTRFFLPGAATLLADVGTDLARMLAPLEIENKPAEQALRERAASVAKTIPTAPDDQLGLSDIDALTSASRDEAGGLHGLVMDIHKALNRLAAATAVESLDGARVHNLNDRDRACVKAFMRGLNRAAPLVFGHPGLGTIAVRANERLTIQNDIGTTDAHVLVVHVDECLATVTYTDIHRPRAKFFMSLFSDHGVEWAPLAEQSGSGFSEDVFYLLTGRFCSQDDEAIHRFLEFLGSRIVFLIDWNKARKALQTFVGKNAAVDLLTWAAKHDYGHRAFVELGGADLVFEAIHRAAPGRIQYGVRLDEALGIGPCLEFLERVLRETSRGLAAGRSTRLIRDEIQADLSRQFDTAESSVFNVIVRHLGLSRTLAGGIADIVSANGRATKTDRQAFAHRAKGIEAKADQLTVTARDISSRIRESAMLRPVIDDVENATDALEDCAFLLSLVPDPAAAIFGVAALTRLSQTVVDSVGHLVRAVEAASRLPDGHRADAVIALEAIDAVANAERTADDAERETFSALVAEEHGDARALVLGLDIARALETATDHLSHAALSLRDRVLEELSA